MSAYIRSSIKSMTLCVHTLEHGKHLNVYDAPKQTAALFLWCHATGFASRTQMVDISGHYDVSEWGPAQLIATIGRFCPRVTAFVNAEVRQLLHRVYQSEATLLSTPTFVWSTSTG